MKQACCYFAVALCVIILGSQIYIINRLNTQTRFAPEVSTLPSPVSAVTPFVSLTQPTAASPSGGQEEQLILKRENPAACSFTDAAEFTLDTSYMITRIRTWYSWGQNEENTPYTIVRDDRTVASGTLTRKDCDPYQHQWCVAADYGFNKPLTAGTYVLKVPKAQICQNSMSGGKGMIYVWGK